jgi:hypothetical protein
MESRHSCAEILSKIEKSPSLRFSEASRSAVFTSEKPRKTLIQRLVAPTGFDRMTSWLEVDFGGVGLAA